MDAPESKKTCPAASSEAASFFRSFLESQKAMDIEVFNIRGPESLIDIMIIASATSRRHAQGLADGIGRICKEKNFEYLGQEGYDLADWILIDCNDIVIHIFQDVPRKLYRLEELCARSLHAGEGEEK